MLGAEVARELERRLGRVELARDADEEALEALDRLGAVPGLVLGGVDVDERMRCEGCVPALICVGEGLAHHDVIHIIQHLFGELAVLVNHQE